MTLEEAYKISSEVAFEASKVHWDYMADCMMIRRAGFFPPTMEQYRKEWLLGRKAEKERQRDADS